MKQLDYYVTVFNDHQLLEGNEDLIITTEAAKQSSYFLNWLKEFSDEDPRDLYLTLINNR